MNYAKINYFDTGNARGLSTVLFVQGCTHKCDGCFNPETHDFCGGRSFTEEVKNNILKSLENSHIKNLVISGGDPLNPENVDEVTKLCREVKEKFPDKYIIVYSGHRMLEILAQRGIQLFAYIDILIDNRFNKNMPTSILDYRGSTNQDAWFITDGEVFLISDYYFREEKEYREDIQDTLDSIKEMVRNKYLR